MSSAGKRERNTEETISIPDVISRATGKHFPQNSPIVTGKGKQITVSESHRRNPDTGSYDAGGPFFTSRTTSYSEPGHVMNATDSEGRNVYSGPVLCTAPSQAQMTATGYTPEVYGSENQSQMTKDGATAVSQCAPTNPASNLGTTLAESFREGVPTLPGIQSWRARTEVLKGLGSEYLNYQFGWEPLRKEVNSVVDTAMHHKKIMSDFHHGEGRNTHRRFDFPSSKTISSGASGFEYPTFVGPFSAEWFTGIVPSYQISRVVETKRWFEGCFTYALPTSTYSWSRGIGFGENAEQLYGLELTPSVLWELTPWSWVVDWFSNAGDVINNVTNFGTAGLVMRYGYIMEETIDVVSKTLDSCRFQSNEFGSKVKGTVLSSPCSRGRKTITKRRVAANPFGFGIGWEGLSPTQLAITAALGITKLL